MKKMLNKLEMKVLELALRHPGQFFELGRQQIPFLRVKRRKQTGVGFHVDFEHGDGAPSVREAAQPGGFGQPPSIYARHCSSDSDLYSFLVWLDQDGYIVSLEAHSLTGDTWPEPPFEGFHDFQDENGRIVAAE